ncbi:hypothetical protein JW796_01655 [Candidatus Dojkabacteria bacterium]|nr:hypothetical protein [Candidatus Dojkabacteria bacterium]
MDKRLNNTDDYNDTNDPKSAFVSVTGKYPNINCLPDLLVLDRETLFSLCSDVFTNGLDYLYKRHSDSKIRNASFNTLETLDPNSTLITERKAKTVFVENKLLAILIINGIIRENNIYDDLEKIKEDTKLAKYVFKLGEYYLENGEPQFAFRFNYNPEATNSIEQDLSQGIILLPPHFFARCIQKPIEGLATIVYLSSQLRDFANNQIYQKPEIATNRALCLEKRFLESLSTQQQNELEGYYKYLLMSENYSSATFDDLDYAGKFDQRKEPRRNN